MDSQTKQKMLGQLLGLTRITKLANMFMVRSAAMFVSQFVSCQLVNKPLNNCGLHSRPLDLTLRCTSGSIIHRVRLFFGNVFKKKICNYFIF